VLGPFARRAVDVGGEDGDGAGDLDALAQAQEAARGRVEAEPLAELMVPVAQ
jgi:hypothetical protein